MSFDTTHVFSFESLETRSMMSVGVGTPPSQPATSIPPTVTVSGPTNPTRTPLPGTVFDATWGGESNPRFSNFLWMHPACFSNARGELDYSEERVRGLARWARDGGENWRHDQTTPQQYVVLDVEHIPWHEGYRDQIANVLTWFKEEAPHIAVGLYGFKHGDYYFSRDDQSQLAISTFYRDVEYNRPVYSKLDSVVIDVYLMGPHRVNEDLASFRRAAWHYRQVFPDLPVVAWTWGNYHTEWNPAMSPLGHKVARRYLSVAWQNFDAIVVWGAHVQNVRWKSYLATLSNWKINVTYRPLLGAATQPGMPPLYKINVWSTVEIR